LRAAHRQMWRGYRTELFGGDGHQVRASSPFRLSIANLAFFLAHRLQDCD
jgi:hypothetical protein